MKEIINYFTLLFAHISEEEEDLHLSHGGGIYRSHLAP